MPRLQDETNEGNGLALAKRSAVIKPDDFGQPGAVGGRLAFGNAGFVVAGIAQFGKSLQGHGREPACRSAEIVLLRVLLVVRRALVAAGIPAEKINSLWLMCKRSKLQRQRFAASLKLQLLSISMGRREGGD